MIEKIAINLIKKGVSLNKIQKKTGINKSTLYLYYKKIKGRKFKKVSIDLENQEAIGEFIGVFAGDGNFFYGKNYHYRIRISTGILEKEYMVFLKKFLTDLFSKKPRVYKDDKNNVYIIDYYSKDIYLLIKKYLIWNENKTKSVKLKKIDKNNVPFLIGFLRGLFDTDGGIYAPKKKVAFGTSSKLLAHQIKEILAILGMKSGFYEYKNVDFWYLDLYGKRTDKFMSIINPHNPRKDKAALVQW